MIEEGEDPEAAARREAEEELGVRLTAALQPLGELRQAGGKRVEAFAVEQEIDTAAVTSISFEMEWPPRSGRVQSFPEVDAARWFDLAEAAEQMLLSQRPFLERLQALLAR
jgi:predicted NUDIX family NTP pyrophosphohydrolase